MDLQLVPHLSDPLRSLFFLFFGDFFSFLFFALGGPPFFFFCFLGVESSRIRPISSVRVAANGAKAKIKKKGRKWQKKGKKVKKKERRFPPIFFFFFLCVRFLLSSRFLPFSRFPKKNFFYFFFFFCLTNSTPFFSRIEFGNFLFFFVNQKGERGTKEKDLPSFT